MCTCVRACVRVYMSACECACVRACMNAQALEVTLRDEIQCSAPLLYNTAYWGFGGMHDGCSRKREGIYIRGCECSCKSTCPGVCDWMIVWSTVRVDSRWSQVQHTQSFIMHVITVPDRHLSSINRLRTSRVYVRVCLFVSVCVCVCVCVCL